MEDSPLKTAIVIGASGGIGRAVALRRARDGLQARRGLIDTTL